MANPARPRTGPFMIIRWKYVYSLWESITTNEPTDSKFRRKGEESELRWLAGDASVGIQASACLPYPARWPGGGQVWKAVPSAPIGQRHAHRRREVNLQVKISVAEEEGFVLECG